MTKILPLKDVSLMKTVICLIGENGIFYVPFSEGLLPATKDDSSGKFWRGSADPSEIRSDISADTTVLVVYENIICFKR